MSKAFVTGSRKYGTPREDSDIDVVINMSTKDIERIKKAGFHDEIVGYDDCDISMRFGKLNLIIFANDAQFNAWAHSTNELLCSAPVTREKAVEVISKACRDVNDIRSER